MDQKIILGLLGAIVITILLVLWCHGNMGKCKSDKKPQTAVRMGPTTTRPPRGYAFQNTGGPFTIQLVEKSATLPETPTLTLFVDAKGHATVSSAMTTYKPRIRRHEARYNKNQHTGNETAVPVDTPGTFWCTYDTDEGLQLGSGNQPTPLSTLIIADTYVPLGTFSMEIQGPGISGMQAIPEKSKMEQNRPCRYRLKKPYE